MTVITAISCAFLFSILCETSALVLPNSTDLLLSDNNFTDIETALAAHLDSAKIPKARRKRYISQNDMIAILDYHNQVRGKVFPPASNMEYMVWDETLAKSAEAWAATCIWDHGPSYLLRFLGQNLSVRTGRYRSILQLVKPWYDEVKDYAFPYPQDCNPRCPMRCYGPMCTHYTQMVWATSNRIGCAIHTCHNMNVWGSVWRRAVYLVCNYAPNLTSICASSVGCSFILTLHLNIQKMNDFGIQGRKGNNLMCMEQNQKLVFCYCYYYNSFCLPPLC
ncbi:peptidase inhibitor 15 isoform X1 [Aquila chrysaetos chrysaetos]|uniref:peptidase inhibitor 15 isoform X1 n=1 Tax=Aquila chrysaetos chrysaetos TaxID=223781 RepID=UPI0011772A01|nr:peptidase inhibitor 15 isoform X1 [Aquila chrysaetos chrysaetos]